MTAVRTLDSETRYDDPIGMYKALNNIENVLEPYSFQYANLSFGPDLPIEDDDVSAWTSILDGLLSSRDMLLSVAVGNNGEMNAESGNNRIEPPGDAVNALGVGACDSENDTGRELHTPPSAPDAVPECQARPCGVRWS